MKIKSLCAAVALSITSCPLWATPYQTEVGAVYTDIADIIDLMGVGVEWHFAPVATDGHPLAEAAFLEQSSSVSVIHAKTDVDVYDLEISTTLLNLGYYVPNSMFYVGAVLQRTSGETQGFSASDTDWGLTLGVSPVEGLLITTDYMNEPGYNLNLTAKYVRKLEGDTAINIDASFTEGDDEPSLLGDGADTTSLGVDYYFNRNFSVGAVFNDAAESEYGVRTQVFFTQQFSAGAEYLTVDSENIITLVAAFRF